VFGYIRNLTRAQRNAFFFPRFAGLVAGRIRFLSVFSSFFVFCLRAISTEFHTDVKSVGGGHLSSRWRSVRSVRWCSVGWRRSMAAGPILMINIVSYSAVELASACSAPRPIDVAGIACRLFGFCHGRRVGRGCGIGARDACLPKDAASSPACCRKVLRYRLPAGVDRVRVRISFTSAGAECSSSAHRRRCWCFTIRGNGRGINRRGWRAPAPQARPSAAEIWGRGGSTICRR